LKGLEMPVTVELDYDGYILHYKITDPLDLTDLLKAYDVERELRDATPHVLHSINDFSELRQIPKNWLQARSGPGLKHPRAGEMIFIGLSPGLKIVVDIILKLTRYTRIQNFRTKEEAEPYIQALVETTKAETEAQAGR
jgi:hypothetical protein